MEKSLKDVTAKKYRGSKLTLKAKRKRIVFFFFSSNQSATNETLKSHEPGRCNVQMEAGMGNLGRKMINIQIREEENKAKQSDGSHRSRVDFESSRFV